MKIHTLFPTQIVHETLGNAGRRLLSDLRKESLAYSRIDDVGREWCRKNNYLGYTSYQSLPQIHHYSPTFETLEKIISKKVNAYAKKLKLHPEKYPLEIDTMWINVMEKNAFHSSHTHPLSVVSGTFYVQTPMSTSQIRFEDPRFPFMMAQPLKDIPSVARQRAVGYSSPYHFEIYPKANDLVLFESFLRHEVPLNLSQEKRISISFNYRLK